MPRFALKILRRLRLLRSEPAPDHRRGTGRCPGRYAQPDVMAGAPAETLPGRCPFRHRRTPLHRPRDSRPATKLLSRGMAHLPLASAL